MTRILLACVAVVLLGVGSVYAQESGGSAGRLEIGAFPGGAMLFTKTSNGNEPEFGNYALGGSLTVNVNRFVAIEGEGGGTIGLHQSFNFGDTAFTDQRTPNMFMYNGNVVVNPGGSDRSLVPYGTGGIGGLTMSPSAGAEALGITNHETYLTGNVGGGLKWFSTHHFGVRGDYRFFMVNNKNTAPAFFGTENRYGHRIQGGLIFTY